MDIIIEALFPRYCRRSSLGRDFHPGCHRPGRGLRGRQDRVENAEAMSDSAELRRRLSRLGQRSSPATPTRTTAANRPGDLPSGDLVDTPLGPAYCIETHYPDGHLHGGSSLSDLLRFDSKLAAEVARQPDLEGASLEGCVFLDTETTGLVGGAGTLVFLVGVGVFRDGAFYLRQYFLRDPAEEAGMLHALQGDIDGAAGFVTFNGRAFDLPLLEARSRLSLRQRWSLTTKPQLDLLYPARRLWRRALPDCSLNTIERHILSVQRTEADVPGELIPSIYLHYLRSGDASEIARVIYHNAVDILSLVTLAAQILERHQAVGVGHLSGSEALAVAHWHQQAGRSGLAEAAFSAALGRSASEGEQLEALRRFTQFLKRRGRREEAVEGWLTWHTLAPEDVTPCIELAKHYEWHARDLDQAQRWAQEALICLSYRPADWRRDQAWGEVTMRLRRLERKSQGR